MPKLSKNRFPFTKQRLENLPISEKDTHFHDEGQKGLMIIVRSSGAKTFWVRYYVNGRECKRCIGSFGSITIENARKIALDYINNAAKGVNLLDEERAKREEITFGKMCNDFIENYSKKRKKSWRQDVTQIPLYLGRWYNKRASEITRMMVEELHYKLCGEDEAHPIRANRTLERISAIYNKAIEWRMYEGNNPARGIKKFKEISRKRILERNEYSTLFKSLLESPHRDAKDIIFIALITGIRRGNILSMKWKDLYFDYEIPIWHIPYTKNGNSQDAILIPIIVELLQSRKELQKSNPSEFVFPGTGETGHLMEPKRSIRSIFKNAGIENIRVHDLRRTLATTVSRSGANDLTIKNILGHANSDVTAVYVRPEYETKYALLEKSWELTLSKLDEFNRWW